MSDRIKKILDKEKPKPDDKKQLVSQALQTIIPLENAEIRNEFSEDNVRERKKMVLKLNPDGKLHVVAYSSKYTILDKNDSTAKMVIDSKKASEFPKTNPVTLKTVTPKEIQKFNCYKEGDKDLSNYFIGFLHSDYIKLQPLSSWCNIRTGQRIPLDKGEAIRKEEEEEEEEKEEEAKEVTKIGPSESFLRSYRLRQEEEERRRREDEDEMKRFGLKMADGTFRSVPIERLSASSSDSDDDDDDEQRKVDKKAAIRERRENTVRRLRYGRRLCRSRTNAVFDDDDDDEDGELEDYLNDDESDDYASDESNLSEDARDEVYNPRGLGEYRHEEFFGDISDISADETPPPSNPQVDNCSPAQDRNGKQRADISTTDASRTQNEALLPRKRKRPSDTTSNPPSLKKLKRTSPIKSTSSNQPSSSRSSSLKRNNRGNLSPMYGNEEKTENRMQSTDSSSTPSSRKSPKPASSTKSPPLRERNCEQ